MSQTLYPGGPTLTLRVAFDTDPLADTPTWTDITRYLRAWKVGMGRSSELSHFDPGEALFVLSNADRRFDPEYSAGAYFGKLLPRKKINFRITYGGTTVDLFTGFVDGWPQEYKKNKESFVNLKATDAFKLFASRDLPSSLYELIVLADSPYHWWKMGEASGALVDTGCSAYQEPLPANGSPTYGATGLLPYDGDNDAVTFDGVNDYFGPTSFHEAPGGTNLAWTNSDDWSIECWFATSVATGTLLSDVFRSGVANRAVVLDLTGGNVRARTKESAGIFTGSVTSPGTYNDGLKHHVVVVYDRTAQDLFLYVDGTLVGSDTTAGDVVFQNPLLIGATDANGSGPAAPFFTGTMQHVALYQGQLSAATILRHYNAGANGLPEATGTRVGRVLDFYGWPAADRAIDTGNSTVPAHDLSGQTVLSYLQLVAQSENGAFYMLGDGKANFRQRHATITESLYNTSQATFGDLKTSWAGGTELPYFDIDAAGNDDTDIINEARITREGGVEQYYADATSQDDYGPSSAPSRTGQLMTDDNEARAACEWIVARGKDPQYRVRAVTVKPRHPTASAVLWPKVRDLFLEHRITVVRRPQSVGSAITKDCLIQSISHEGSATKRSWSTEYELAPADPETGWFILNTSALDTGKLAY